MPEITRPFCMECRSIVPEKGFASHYIGTDEAGLLSVGICAACRSKEI